MDYHKLNAFTKMDHFLIPFIDQMLDRRAKSGTIVLMDIQATIRFSLY